MKAIIIAIASAMPLASVEAGRDNVFTGGGEASNAGEAER